MDKSLFWLQQSGYDMFVSMQSVSKRCILDFIHTKKQIVKITLQVFIKIFLFIYLSYINVSVCVCVCVNVRTLSALKYKPND